MTQPTNERARYQCTVAGYEAVFVRFSERGYPHKLRREWPGYGEDQVLATTLRYVVEWHMVDLAGQALSLPAVHDDLDEVEWAVLGWLVTSFVQWLLIDQHERPAAEEVAK